MERIKFDLVRALNGAKLIRRDGRIIDTPFRQRDNYIAHQYGYRCDGTTYNEHGKLLNWMDSDRDLFMLHDEWTPKRGETVWGNNNCGYWVKSFTFITKDGDDYIVRDSDGDVLTVSHIEPVPKKQKMTIDDIERKLGYEIEIINNK